MLSMTMTLTLTALLKTCPVTSGSDALWVGASAPSSAPEGGDVAMKCDFQPMGGPVMVTWSKERPDREDGIGRPILIAHGGHVTAVDTRATWDVALTSGRAHVTLHHVTAARDSGRYRCSVTWLPHLETLSDDVTVAVGAGPRDGDVETATASRQQTTASSSSASSAPWTPLSSSAAASWTPPSSSAAAAPPSSSSAASPSKSSMSSSSPSSSALVFVYLDITIIISIIIVILSVY
ncbi:uncharacterized protein LOC142907720 [Petromyzon marinus]|uniref:uncharacterized protein LOC142907720 n=1 Tax=Petromyzon marinus TaxID=7757 RepID=UPI003F6F85A5